MKAVAVAVCTALVAVADSAKPNISNGIPAEARPEVARAVEKAARRPHPRLFADARGFAALKTRLGKEELLTAGAEFVRRTADACLETKPCERIKEGKRLLGVSRTALYRINTLALAYRLYGKKAHLDRAIAELRAVCAFSDWNPSHFLDVGEMTLAVAIGYDWLYNDMPEDVRREIAAGLRRCGLDASRQPLWWIRARNNWGQVCHAGILAGSLALAEENPAETACFVQRCIDFLPISMKALAPNGNYPEGPGYWNYGLEFNVAAMALLEGTLGSDFGLASMPGFAETGAYLDLVTGPSGGAFNYADGGAGRGTCYATWWFAKRFNRPDIIPYFELGAYRRYVAYPRLYRGNRMFPLALFWVQDVPAGLQPRAPLVWDAKGPVPITIQRSSWDDEKAMFVGLKGGSPSAPHGHMDGGSFVLDSGKVRWAVDIGPEPYHRIEAMGMNLWSGAQNSDRWKLFRLGQRADDRRLPAAGQGKRGGDGGEARWRGVRGDARPLVALHERDLGRPARRDGGVRAQLHAARHVFRREAGREDPLGDDDASRADHRRGQGGSPPEREVHHARPVRRAEGRVDRRRRTGAEQMGLPKQGVSPADVHSPGERRGRRLLRRQLFSQLEITVWRS